MSTALEPLHIQLDAREIPLERLFLDPNNPRFVGLHSVHVPDEKVADEGVQAEAIAILDKYFGIDRVRMNMSVNGYLPIDRIVVREIGSGNFVVLEGNRRVAAAKTLPQYTEDGDRLDDRVLESVRILPALVYTGADPGASWLFQGIRHIVGINDWSAYNKARLLVEQMQKEGLSLTAAGRRFGLSPHGAGQWVRSYFAFKQAKELTDYVSEVDEKLYPYMQEIFGRSSVHMKEWLGWDESASSFRNADRLNEFVGWFYPREAAGEVTDDFSVRGDWEKKRIGNRDDIRQLSYMIQYSPRNFQLFRDGLDFDAAYGQAMVEQYEAKRKEADVNASQVVFDAIDACAHALNNMPLALVKSPELSAALREKLARLDDAIAFSRS